MNILDLIGDEPMTDKIAARQVPGSVSVGSEARVQSPKLYGEPLSQTTHRAAPAVSAPNAAPTCHPLETTSPLRQVGAATKEIANG